MEPNWNFQQHVEFILIEPIRKEITTEETRKLLKKTRILLYSKSKNFITIEIKSRIK